MKLELSWRILKKYSDIKFHENPSIKNWVIPYRQMDMCEEDNSRFSQLCEHAFQNWYLSISTSPTLEPALCQIQMIIVPRN